MDELKAVFASNLIRLRTEAGLTQAELGRQLNYSDKTISKWERAEAMPDALVLLLMGEMFHVTVDYLLHEHSEWEGDRARARADEERPYNRGAITAVSITGLWTVAVLLFVCFWISGKILWVVFPCAVPLTLITLLGFNTMWNRGRWNMMIVMALVLCLLVLVYFLFFRINMWQLFLVAIPAELVVFFSFRIRRSRRDGKAPGKESGT